MLRKHVEHVDTTRKRKNCPRPSRVCTSKVPRYAALLERPPQTGGATRSSSLAPRPLLLRPLLAPPVSYPKHRCDPLRIKKMTYLLKQQALFMKQVMKRRTSPFMSKYDELASRVGVAKAGGHGDKLAYFFLPKTWTRGTCKVFRARRACWILGAEYRQDAPSFRLYMAVKSTQRTARLSSYRRVLDDVLGRFGVTCQIIPKIMSFLFHGLIFEGYEILAGHFLSRLPKTCKPPNLSQLTSTPQVRMYSRPWSHKMTPKTLDDITFLVRHARRDVQVVDCRVEQIMYTNII